MRRRRQRGVEAVASTDTRAELGDMDGREQSTSELVKQLAAETSTLVKQEVEFARAEAARIGEGVMTLARQELRLAKAEMGEKGRKAGPGFGMIGAAGATGLLSAGALTAFLILPLAGGVANWVLAA